MPVVGAMFGTYNKNEQNSTVFWRAVRDETGETPNCADRRIAKYLSLARNRSSYNTKATRLSPVREIYVKCIHAWNAWRKNVTTNLNYHPDKEVPQIN